MMEGALSLMQMAKISAALGRLDRAGAALPVGPHGSDDRRRHGELRDAGRSEHRRTEGAHRLCRTARHRADDPAETARRAFSAASSSIEKGFLDLIVDRRELKATIARTLRVMMGLPPASPRPSAAAAATRGALRVEAVTAWPSSALSARASLLSLEQIRHQARPRADSRAARRARTIPSAPSRASSSPAPTARAR